jgi:hypothetical protein
MNRAVIHPAIVAACCLVAAAALAQSKHNPTGDPDVEKGYQKHQQEHRERQQKAQQSQPPKESTGTKKDEGTYGKDWQEKQLGTEGKVRTW